MVVNVTLSPHHGLAGRIALVQGRPTDAAGQLRQACDQAVDFGHRDRGVRRVDSQVLARQVKKAQSEQVVGHADDLRVEAGDDVDQIRLRRHHPVDVFIRHRNLIDPRRQKLNAGFLQERPDVVPAELAARSGSAHGSTGSV